MSSDSAIVRELDTEIRQLQTVLECNAYRFAGSVDDQTLEDTVQETWVVALQKLRGREDIENFGAFLKRVQVNLILDHIRRKGRRKESTDLSDVFDLLGDPDSGPLENLLRSEHGQLLRRAISELAPGMMDFAMAACDEGIENTDALCRRLSMTPDQVSRLRYKLKEWFHKHYFDAFGDIRAMPIILLLAAWDSKNPPESKIDSGVPLSEDNG